MVLRSLFLDEDEVEDDRLRVEDEDEEDVFLPVSWEACCPLRDDTRSSLDEEWVSCELALWVVILMLPLGLSVWRERSLVRSALAERPREDVGGLVVKEAALSLEDAIVACFG